MLQTKNCTQNQNTHSVFIQHFFENRTAYEIKWKKKKFCIAGQATYENMAHAHCMLDN